MHTAVFDDGTCQEYDGGEDHENERDVFPPFG